MKRRSFLGSVLAALAAPALSSAELLTPAPSPVVWNTATLTEALRKMFACQMGPAFAFFEVSKKTGDIIEVKPDNVARRLGEQMPLDEGRKRYVYETYACAIEGGDAKEAEARLAKHFYDHFSQLPAGPLIWRVEPQFSSDEKINWGVTYATREQIEDHQYDLANLPEDAQYDIEWGSYRQVLSKSVLHKMRMRLVLPHIYDPETIALPELFKQEGARTTRII